MREIWENPYANALLKIERADKHISDIEQRLSSSQDSYHLSLHFNASTGKQFVLYSLAEKYIRASLALTIGDAIHNLKCALDIAWSDTIQSLSPAGYNPRIKFPVYETRERLESVLQKTTKILPDSSLYKFMVKSVKSYQGGDSDIWAIHQLDIDDKHHLLIPVLNVLSIEGVELEQENGQVDCLTLALTGPIPGWIEVPLGSKLKNYGHATFEVKFRDGIPAEGLEVVPTLRRFSAKTLEIVRILRRMSL
jgi:hypothetical protein